MELLETKYQKFEFDKPNSILIQNWQASTVDMDDDEYKKEQLSMLKFVRENDATKLLANTKEFRLPLVPEMQEWTSREINDVMYKSGITKVAFIVTSNIFSQVSIEQTQNENPDDCFVLKYFDNANEGIKWLKE